MDEKHVLQSKIVWTQLAAIVALLERVFSGELPWEQAIPLLAPPVLTIVFRLLPTKSLRVSRKEQESPSSPAS